MLLTSTPLPIPTGQPSFDWATVIVSLVVGLGGGVVSALVTTGAQKRIARSGARATAASAMWTFHRTLRDYAAEAEAHFVDDGSVSVTKTTREDIAAARAQAYPYKTYLGADATLVERGWHSEGLPGDDPMIPYDDVWEWAKELEKAITRAFGAKQD